MASFTSKSANKNFMLFFLFIGLILFGFYVSTFTTKLFIQFAFAAFVFALLLIPSKAMLKTAFAILIIAFSLGPRSIDVSLLRVFTSEPFIWILFLHAVVKKSINNQPLIPENVSRLANISLLLVFFSFLVALAYGDPLDIVFNRTKALYIFLPIFVLVNYMITDEKTFEFALNVFFMSALIVSLFGIIQFFMPGMVIFSKEFISKDMISGIGAPMRVTSFWGHPGILAEYLFPVSLIALSMCFQKTNLKFKLLPFCTFISSVICLAFTFTRAAWGALFAGILVIQLIKIRNTKMLLIFIIGCICLYFFMPKMYLRRVESAIYFQGSSSQKHLQRMVEGTEMLKDKLLAGHGWKVSSNLRFNNLYLQLGVAIGILGVILFLLLQGTSLVMGIRALMWTENDFIASALTGLIAAMVGAFVSFSWGNALFDIDVIIPYWFEVSLLAVLYKIVYESKFTK